MRIKIAGSQRELTLFEQTLIERHLNFALCRFENLARSATVTVSERALANECEVRLSLRSASMLLGRGRGSGLEAAARQAAQRVVGAVNRHLVAGIPAGMQLGDGRRQAWTQKQ